MGQEFLEQIMVAAYLVEVGVVGTAKFLGEVHQPANLGADQVREREAAALEVEVGESFY